MISQLVPYLYPLVASNLRRGTIVKAWALGVLPAIVLATSLWYPDEELARNFRHSSTTSCLRRVFSARKAATSVSIASCDILLDWGWLLSLTSLTSSSATMSSPALTEGDEDDKLGESVAKEVLWLSLSSSVPTSDFCPENPGVCCTAWTLFAGSVLLWDGRRWK